MDIVDSIFHADVSLICFGVFFILLYSESRCPCHHYKSQQVCCWLILLWRSFLQLVLLRSCTTNLVLSIECCCFFPQNSNTWPEEDKNRINGWHLFILTLVQGNDIRTVSVLNLSRVSHWNLFCGFSSVLESSPLYFFNKISFLFNFVKESTNLLRYTQ